MARYSDEQLAQAVDALTDRERFREAESVVAASAPGLQRVLLEALEAGGWFDDSHQAELLKAATMPDAEERLRAVRTLLAEETRVAMMIGVAAGWALNDELADRDEEAGPDGPA